MYSYLFVFVCVEGPSSHWVSVDVCRVLNQSGREFGVLGVTLCICIFIVYVFVFVFVCICICIHVYLYLYMVYA